MSRRKFSLTSVTRSMTADVDDSFADLVAALWTFAAIVDDPDTSARDRIWGTIEWRATVDALSSRVVDQARKEVSWAESRPKAV